MAKHKKAVFLDRDGTLNHDPGYLNDAQAVVLYEGVGEALAALSRAGFLLVVVTNQSGIARGLIQPAELEKIHLRLNEILKPFDVQIDRFEFCSHHPDDGCSCRKPKPELIIRSADQLDIDLKNSYMIGDRSSDLEVGINAGCRSSLLVRTGRGQETLVELERKNSEILDRSVVVSDLRSAADWVLSQSVLG